MLSHQLVHRTNAILRGARPLIPWLPSSLGPLQCSHIFRAYSWSSQSQTANWSHLNDVYSRAVDVKSKELPNSPDERWAMQSRSKMANLKPPKGPYAGTTVFSPLSNLEAFSHINPGRSIEVKNGNVAEALNQLQYTLQRNRVATELRLTARHEKKGYKRRRLSSERWRRRFAHEVWASFLWCDVS
jgi:ribosomal protein S21